MFKRLLEWDQQALIYMNNLGSEQFDLFWLITTNFLTWIPLCILLVILIVHVHGSKQGILMLANFAGMLFLLTAAIFAAKEGFARLRPVNDPEINPALRVIINPSDFSFFSGHAASSFSIVSLAVFFLRKRMKLIYTLLLWPILFSYSRMYLGVHFPLDIIVGTLVGIAFAFLFYKIHFKTSGRDLA